MKKTFNYLLAIILFMSFFLNSAFSLTSQHYMLTWESVINNTNYPVKGYKIYYGPTSGNYTKSIVIENTETLSYDINDLDVSDMDVVFCVVVSYTEIEDGLRSEEICFRDIQKPSITIK